MIAESSGNVYLAIIALATLGNGWINYRNKENARKDKEEQRKRDEEKARATEERDKILAEGTAAVARKAEEVAAAAKDVKDHLQETDKQTDIKLHDIKEVTDKTHVIVNNQKTLMLESFARQCGLTLNVTKILASQKPNDKNLQEAVLTAQTLYDKASQEAKANEATS